MQKPGIIALLNDSLNGGYTFSEYSWYRNGERIEGADQSYLIVGTNDLGAQYTVVLKRTTDGVTVATCPVIYNGTMAVETPETSGAYVWPTIAIPGQTITVIAESSWMLTDVLGRVIVPISSNKQLTAPQQPGMYMLVFPHTHKTIRMIVK